VADTTAVDVPGAEAEVDQEEEPGPEEEADQGEAILAVAGAAVADPDNRNGSYQKQHKKGQGV
jgi:hypothetical protein